MSEKIKKESDNKEEEFWDKNPCGGKWLSFKEKREWLKEKEPYALDLLQNDFLKNKNVLDVGCGQGFLLSLIAEKADKAIGIDKSSESLAQARKGMNELKLNNVELILGDAEKLPFENETFDTVYSIGVLHHTAKTEEAIKEIRRVLRKDGTAVVMLYRKYVPKWVMVRFLRGISKIIDVFSKEKWWLAKKMRASKEFNNSNLGTAALELFGCPILKAYTINGAKKMFPNFKSIKISCVQPGFERILDILPFLRFPFEKVFRWIDKRFDKMFGFYIVIEAKKYL